MVLQLLYFPFSPVINTNYKYTLSIGKEQIEYYIDDVLYNILNVVTTLDQPFLAGSQPVCINHYITNDGAAGSICQMNFTSYSVSFADWQTTKSCNHIESGMGLTGNLLTNGYASGSYQTPVYPAYNSVIATTTPISGGTGFAVGLGGRTQWVPGEIETAMERIIYSYQNPVPYSGQTGRNLYITGVKVSSVVTSTLASATTCYCLDLGYGSTSQNLDAVESTTFSSPTTKSYRKVPLGFQKFSANSV